LQLHFGALKASSIGSCHFFSAAYSKRQRFLTGNSKSSFSSPNVNWEDGSVGGSLFRGSAERWQSTLVECSTVADEASTSTGKCSESGTDTTKGTARRKKSIKRMSRAAKTSKTAAETSENASVKNQEEIKKADTSKSKKGVGSSMEKNRVTSAPKRSSKAKESDVAKNRTKISAHGSGSERKPLTPLYPPTAKSVVVVESVAKAKVIQKFLGDMYQVLPSHGHVRDLAGRSRSVRPEDDFSMVWEVPAAAWTHLKSIRAALKGYA
jgi:hypothetical protein